MSYDREVVWLSPLNQVYCRIECDEGIAADIEDHFSFFVQGAWHMPKFKAGIWDGKIRIFKAGTSQFPIGLIPDLCSWAARSDVEIRAPELVAAFSDPVYDQEILDEFLDGLDIRDENDNKLELHEHQRQAVHRFARTRRSLLLSPTSSGKSLITYCFLRWLLWRSEELEEPGTKILVVVPTTILVSQLLSDFGNYSSRDEGFSAATLCHGICSGKEKVVAGTKITISTWQSIFNLNKAWFANYRALIVDEAHLAEGKSISKIGESCTGSPYRIGMTGTLSGAKANEMVIKSMFGPVSQYVTTTELMDKGIVAQLTIKNLILKWSPEVIKAFWDLPVTYDFEKKFLEGHPDRLAMIGLLANGIEGNALLMFTRKEHGRQLGEACAAIGKKRVFVLSGDNSPEDRDAVKAMMETSSDMIVCASYGIFSTGVSIRNIHHVVLASGAKGRVRNLQTIGRGLRKSGTKSSVILWDLVDDLCKRSKDGRVILKKNYSMDHFLTRVGYYDEEGFNYTNTNVAIGAKQ